MNGTITGMSRPASELTEEQVSRLTGLAKAKAKAYRELKKAAIEVLAEPNAPIRAVSKATGISTNTLQRWKREAAAEAGG